MYRPGTCLLLLCLGLAGVSPVLAATVQVGLPGYLVDSEPLPQATPQDVFDSLRNDADAVAFQGMMLSRDLDVEFSGDRTRGSYVFFGRDHWAYPSVIRFRRTLQDGYWATRISYLCAASRRTCDRLRRKLESRSTQVALMDSATAAQEPVAHLLRPLPSGVSQLTNVSQDYFINEFVWSPDASEYPKNNPVPTQAPVHSTDPNAPRCRVNGISPIFATRPNYPATEDANGLGGTPILLVTLDAEGEVIRTVVERSSHDRFLDREAINAVATFRFAMADCVSGSTDTVIARLPVDFLPGNYRFKGHLKDFDADTFGFGSNGKAAASTSPP